MNNKRNKKSKTSDNLAEQKENRPKRTKKNEPASNESIAMSKQLLMKKKTIRNNSYAKRRSMNTNRICPNGKPMPSLADLEKMFEDSDDDGDEKQLVTNGNKKQLVTNGNTPELPTIQQQESSINIDTNTLFSPSTRIDIIEQAKEILLKISNQNQLHKGLGDATDVPPKEEPILELNDLPPITVTPNNEMVTETDNDANGLIDITNELESNESKQKLAKYGGNVNKYSDKLKSNFTSSQLQNESFSPLPSTSKDNNIFKQNDELFNKSFKEITVSDNNLHNNIITTETIIINDENKEPLNNIKTETEDSKPILSLVDLISPIEVTNQGDQDKYDDNDDCIFVGTQTDTTRKVSNPTEIIDLEYDFVEPVTSNINNNYTQDHEDEIIDVQTIIAENQTIIDSLSQSVSKKLDSSNLVVDVDVSTVTETKQHVSHISTEDSTCLVQSQTNNEHEVINLSDIEDIISRNIQDEENTQVNIVEQNVSASEPENTRYTTRPHVAFNHYNRTLAELENPFARPYAGNYFEDFMNHTLMSYVGIPLSVYEECSNRRGSNLTPSLPQTIQNTLRRQNTPRQRNTARQRNSRRQRNTPRQQNLNIPPTSPLQDQPEQLSEDGIDNNCTPIASIGDVSPERSAGKIGDCPICMESLSGTIIGSTICGHVFCMSCLKASLRTNKRCPTCRKYLRGKTSYHQIFL